MLTNRGIPPHPERLAAAQVVRYLTPKMRRALLELRQRGADLGPDFAADVREIGRPTRQRLAKWGLACFSVPRAWDGSMFLTPKGAAIANGILAGVAS